jgi:hypothetical protein
MLILVIHTLLELHPIQKRVIWGSVEGTHSKGTIKKRYFNKR